MSIRINLRIKTILDLEAIEHNIELPLVRFKTDVKFWTDSSWTRSFDGIIDTGSPITLIPKFIGEVISSKFLSTHNFGISGISPKDTAPLPANLASVSCILLDNTNISFPLNIRCYLLQTNEMPLVIGILDILTISKLLCDYKNNTAYLEF